MCSMLSFCTSGSSRAVEASSLSSGSLNTSEHCAASTCEYLYVAATQEESVTNSDASSAEPASSGCESLRASSRASSSAAAREAASGEHWWSRHTSSMRASGTLCRWSHLGRSPAQVLTSAASWIEASSSAAGFVSPRASYE